MFKKTQNIDTAFRHVRGFTFLIILVNLLSFCFYVYRSDQRVAQAENRVLILLNGKVVEAVSSNRKDNIMVEAKDHIRTFHQLFFSLDPDDKVIQSNIAKALYLCDGSAKREYDNLKERGYYNNIISANISQEIAVDSVNVSTASYPYAFRCYATQKLVRTTSTLYRSLVTEGMIRNVERSDNNPHGMLIENWATIENHDLKTENR